MLKLKVGCPRCHQSTMFPDEFSLEAVHIQLPFGKGEVRTRVCKTCIKELRANGRKVIYTRVI